MRFTLAGPFGLLGPDVGMLILPIMGIRFGEMYKNLWKLF